MVRRGFNLQRLKHGTGVVSMSRTR
jgi:hypothetical protein